VREGEKQEAIIPLYPNLRCNGINNETKEMMVMKRRREVTKHCTRICGNMTMHFARREKRTTVGKKDMLVDVELKENGEDPWNSLQ
jgi:hypothetical protein